MRVIMQRRVALSRLAVLLCRVVGMTWSFLREAQQDKALLSMVLHGSWWPSV